MVFALAVPAFSDLARAEEAPTSFWGQLFGSAQKREVRKLDLSIRTDRQFAFGTDHVLFVTPSGRLLGWGSNIAGQLGQAKLTRETSSGGKFYDVSKGIFDKAVTIEPTDVVSVAAGRESSFYIKRDGTVWALGHARNYQLGLPVNGIVPLPHQIQGLHDIVDIATGPNFATALRKDGAVFVWGSNFDGALGIFLPGFGYQKGEDIATPTRLENIDGVVAVAASYDYLYFLDSEGYVHSPTHARTGAARRLSEEWVRLPIQGVKSLHANHSSNTTFGITETGDVYAWGNGRNYGNGAREDSRRDPVLIPELKGAVKIAVGQDHAVAILADGRVIAWGDNGLNQLGVPNTRVRDRSYPDPVPGVTNAREIYASGSQTMVLTADGRLVYWGDYGPLPDVKRGQIMYVEAKRLDPQGTAPLSSPASPSRSPNQSPLPAS